MPPKPTRMPKIKKTGDKNYWQDVEQLKLS